MGMNIILMAFLRDWLILPSSNLRGIFFFFTRPIRLCRQEDSMSNFIKGD